VSVELKTRYLGLDLAHPLVASASPLTATFDGMRRLEDAGAAAVVMISLHEEQVRGEDTAYALLTEHGSLSQSEAGSYFPELPDYNHGMSGHLESLRRASEALDIPIIASLNGTSEGLDPVRQALERASAAALELNVFLVPADGRPERRWRPGTSTSFAG
jgi:dihydroorotate dehydrogenase (fumarate)